MAGLSLDLWGLFSRTVGVLRARPWLGWLEDSEFGPSYSLYQGEGSFPKRTDDLRQGQKIQCGIHLAQESTRGAWDYVT